MRELLLGCGHMHSKRVVIDGMNPWWMNLTTVDINSRCNPDVLCDLDKTPWPFKDDSFDEIHAYEVLEHLGKQGDYKSFFAHFYEAWRILKPNGVMVATVPGRDSDWVWSDPGHARVITQESLVFLMQRSYEEQAGITPITDYRWVWKGNFDVIALLEDNEHKLFGFALQALKG